MSQSDPRLPEIAYRAREAMVAGRVDEAARLWNQILGLAPDHPQALFQLGQIVLQQGDAARARMLLERASALAPKDAMPALFLALANRKLADVAGESAALELAVAIDPYCYPAHLLNGALLERLGKTRQAARVYKNALVMVPPDDKLSVDLRDQVIHAREVVKKNMHELQSHLEKNLVQLREKHRDADLSRFDECRDVAVGTKKVYTQQPALLHFPGVPAVQFYDNSLFAGLAALESQTAVIRDEFLNLYREDTGGFTPYVDHPAGTPINQWAELNHSLRWSAQHFWRDGVRFDEVCRRCPKTAAAIEAVPKLEIPNFGPTVLFSALAPRTRIPPHTSSTNIRLIVHLPLIVPPGCGFRVGNETRQWEVGKAWVFDDTIEHEAWNDSDELRVILMIDVWNPFLTAVERTLVSALLNGVTEFYR